MTNFELVINPSGEFQAATAAGESDYLLGVYPDR